jgi:hypothetical protein
MASAPPRRCRCPQPWYVIPKDGQPLATASADDRLGSREPLEARFEDAVRANGGFTDHDHLIAGGRVRFRSASPEMTRRLSRAFAHLASNSGDPDLTVHLWDSMAARGTEPPLPQAPRDEPPGAFWYYSDEHLRVGYQHGTSGDARVIGVYSQPPTPALTVLDTATNDAWYWVSDAARIPYWEQATPMVYLFDWWLRDRGVSLLHAGAVGTEAGGVLIVGKSGSGKSTTTLSALQTSLTYAGDDYVAVSTDAPYVHSLYGSGKLMPDHVNRLPFLLPALANPEELGEEKAVVYVHERWPSNTTSGFPLRAIIVPRVVPGRISARLERASALVGLAALAPSTVFQMHTRGQDSLGRMRRLAQQVPSYVLEVGSDMDSIPQAMIALIDQLGERE